MEAWLITGGTNDTAAGPLRSCSATPLSAVREAGVDSLNLNLELRVEETQSYWQVHAF